MASWLGRAAAEITFEVDPRGRPLLSGESAAGGTQFNVSHSGDWALIGLARRRRIGVDLETIRAIPELLSIAEGNFTEPERRALAAVEGEARARFFHWLWTRKEACLKAEGSGLSGGLDRFEVLRGEPEVPMQFQAVTARYGDACPLWVGTPAARPEFVASVAFEGNLVTPQVRLLGLP
ncbi:MAG: 4'-phosphopantetheinyl transferase superfamily protein [Gemmatimonadales bacterium]